MIKEIRSLAFIIFAGFFCYCAILQSNWAQNWVKNYLQQEIEKVSPGTTLTIGSIKITPRLDVYAEDVAIYVQGEKIVYTQIVTYSSGRLYFESDLDLNKIAQILAIDSASLEGKAHLAFSYEQKQYEGKISIDNGLAEIYPLGIKTQASGRLLLKGDLKGAILEGRLASHSLRMQLPKKSPALANPLIVIRPQMSQTTPAKQTKKFPFPLSFNVKLQIPGSGKLKNDSLNSNWKGELSLQGTPLAPELYGEFKLEDGSYLFRGKSLKLSEGTITFAGHPEKKTSLYVIAEIENGSKKFEAIIKGPIRNPAISFRSNPPLSQREILAWILFNRGVGDITFFQGTELNHSLTKLSAAGSYDGPDILTRIGNIFGLDHVDINSSEEGNGSDVSLKVGKYLNKNTLLSISKNVSSNGEKTGPSSTLSIETNLWENYKLQAEIGDDHSGKFNLLWKKDY